MELKKFIPEYKAKKQQTFRFKFTVFTPVFNAQNTITRVNDSLLKQTFKNFEWLIINDGSTDDSHKVITSIINNSTLNINYIYNEENKHKMACFMEAINLANGEFFLTLDADDECVPNSLEVFNEEYNIIPEDLKENIAAVTGLCIDQNNNKIGSGFPKDPYFSNTFKSHVIDGVTGEKWGFTKTSILRNVSYSKEFITNGFMPEGLIWNLIAKEGYKTKYINKALRVYHIGIENSISSSPAKKTALGTAINCIANFNWFFKANFFKAPVFFLKNLYFLLRTQNYLAFKLTVYTASVDDFTVKIFLTLLWPFRKLMK